jgi:hypothetical protein
VLTSEIEKEVFAEIERGTRVLVGIVNRWPNYRREIVLELLGAAAAAAESFGVDSVSAVTRIVSQCGRPAELIPPKGS